MGFSWRKARRVGKTGRVTASTRGVSVSKQAGPVSVNSRGRVSLRLGKGIRWTGKF